MQIYKEFLFEAAHYLPTAAPGTPNARIHGHSFRARIVIEGEPGETTGYVFHFEELARVMAETQDALDHRLLNEIDGLSSPTLERIAMWIWHRLANRVPGLAQVQVSRDSCGEGVMYAGPAAGQRLAAE